MLLFSQLQGLTVHLDSPICTVHGKRHVVDGIKVTACVRRVTWWNKSNRHPEAKAVRFTSNSVSPSDSTTSRKGNLEWNCKRKKGDANILNRTMGELQRELYRGERSSRQKSHRLIPSGGEAETYSVWPGLCSGVTGTALCKESWTEVLYATGVTEGEWMHGRKNPGGICPGLDVIPAFETTWRQFDKLRLKILFLSKRKKRQQNFLHVFHIGSALYRGLRVWRGLKAEVHLVDRGLHRSADSRACYVPTGPEVPKLKDSQAGIWNLRVRPGS